MKNNVETKIKISIFLCIISSIYLAFFDFFYGYLGFSLLGFPWPIVFYSFISGFISVFVYPYIKIDSQSLLKRGLFFGAIMWIINLPQLLMDLRYTIIWFDIPVALSFIKNPLYFIMLGLVISFCYKKFLPVEFNLPLKKLKTPFTKIVLTIVLTTLIYFLFMYFTQALILHILFHIDIWGHIVIDLLHPLLYINPLIYGSIFTVLYTTTIKRADISRTKKWILFSLFISFFTTPLILLSGAITREVFQTYIMIHQFLLLPHLLSIFLIGYLFTRFLDRESLLESSLETKQ